MQKFLDGTPSLWTYFDKRMARTYFDKRMARLNSKDVASPIRVYINAAHETHEED